MPLNHSLVGVPGDPTERSWTSKDALLYAIGVGAGLGDPLEELQFLSQKLPQQSHQSVDLKPGPLPILHGKSVERENFHAQPSAGLDGAAYRTDSRLVAGNARQTPPLGPAAVPVHDNRDVCR